MRKVLFMTSFALIGCGIDSALDSKGALAVWVIAAIVCITTALSIIKE